MSSTRHTGSAQYCHLCARDIERRDGPRYVEAVRGAREMRQRGFVWPRIRNWAANGNETAAYTERDHGIPEGWITRALCIDHDPNSGPGSDQCVNCGQYA